MGLGMQSSLAKVDNSGDLAFAVAASMQKLGVAGLPRNYQIFYEAITGSNESLRRALDTLGHCPSQEDLDQLAHDYFAQNNREGIVETAHHAIACKIEEIIALLRREKNSLEKYGTILDRTSEGLNGSQGLSKDVLLKIVGIMAAATETTIRQGHEIVSSIVDTSAELAEARAKLEEYKQLADTDSLTQIWNRRAFDKALAQIYCDRKKILFGALILIDIDRFKEVNDRYGHPGGDRILQHVARIIKTSANVGMFVARTGGEEFAVIVEGLTEAATVAFADDIRAIVEKTSFLGARSCPGDAITISLGICMASEAGNPEDLYAKADRALYASKLAGRNRVSKYPVQDAGGLRKNWMLYRTD